MVILTAVFFQSDTYSDKAPSLRSIPGPFTNGRNVALNATVAVLDALAYASMHKSSSAIAIGRTKNSLQLVVTTNEDKSFKDILNHLTTICSTLKKISDAKFSHGLSHINLREESPKLDLMDVRLEALFNDLFLKLYKYSYGRWKEKNFKSWKVFEAFRAQFQLWDAADQETDRNKIEQKEIFLRHLQKVRLCALSLQDCLYNTCRPDCETDINQLGTLKEKWQCLLAVTAKILDLTTEGSTNACDYWAQKVPPNGKLHGSAYEIHLVMI